MAITALDIKDKQFTTKFRGYNEQEVDEFLDIIEMIMKIWFVTIVNLLLV